MTNLNDDIRRRIKAGTTTLGASDDAPAGGDEVEPKAPPPLLGGAMNGPDSYSGLGPPTMDDALRRDVRAVRRGWRTVGE